MDLIDALKACPLFAGLEEADLRPLAPLFTECRAKAGEVLFREDESSDGMYIVGAGSVKLTKRTADGKTDRDLVTLGPWDAIGEMSLIDGMRRSATAVAETDVRLFLLSPAGFDRLLGGRDRAAEVVTKNLLKMMAARLRATDKLVLRVMDREAALQSEMEDEVKRLFIEAASSKFIF
jgi:CRP/FNR family cyclic AMP-dependent transcriptional regulator